MIARAQVCERITDTTGLLAVLNNYRQSKGIAPVHMSPILMKSAKWKADDMAVNQYFSHTDSLGRDPYTAAQSFGYPDNLYFGEILGLGAETPEQMLGLWQVSSGHNDIILDANYVAAGVAFGVGAVGARYWVVQWGSYADPEPICINAQAWVPLLLIGGGIAAVIAVAASRRGY